jgi:uncharacterized membrane protein
LNAASASIGACVVVVFMGFNVLLRAIEGETRIREAQELEERMATLERLFAEKQDHGRYYGA